MIQIPATNTAPALTLRPWQSRDIPALLRAHADPEMRRWLMRHINDEQQAQTALADQARDWAAHTRYTFAVLTHASATADAADDRDPIASVSIRRTEKLPEAAEVGYWTAAEARGQSVATRAVEATIQWAAKQWADDPVSRFTLIHTLGNNASCRVAIKLGFELAEELDAHPPKFPEPGHLHVRAK